MTNPVAIGQRVAKLRKQRGLIQDELAAEIGISRSTLGEIERGTEKGGLASMIALADYFKVPMDWLLGREPPPGGPLLGEFVDDPDELAWVYFWRRLTDADRAAVLRLLRIDGRRASGD